MNLGRVGEDGMTCRELVELLTDYLEGALPAAEHADLEAHLAECPGCAEYLAQMRLTVRLSGRLGEAPMLPRDQRRLIHTFRDWKRGR